MTRRDVTGLADDLNLPDDAGGGAPPDQGGNADVSGSGLRKQLEDALAAKKAAETQLGDLQKEQRQRDLTEAGLSEAARADYPPGASTDAAAVKEWLAAKQAAYGVTATQQAPPAAAPPAVSPAAQQAMQQAQQAQAGAVPTAQGLEGLLARMRDKSVAWPELKQELTAYGFE
jgi:hypothetical protein